MVFVNIFLFNKFFILLYYSHFILQRLKRDFPATGNLRSNYTDEEDEGDSYVFPSRVELMESKKVSFGRVEQKVITPTRQLKNSRLHGDSVKARIGVHSRLGTPNFL